MYTNPNQLTITTTGSALAAFTHASFKVAVQAIKATGPEAKDDCKATIAAILKVVTDMAAEGGIKADQLKTSFDVAPHLVHDGRTQVHQGYEATYTLRFQATNVDKATAIHDALTSIPFVKAESPKFHIDSEEARAAAFQDAWEGAKKWLKVQTAIVGHDDESWKLSSWGVQESGEGGGGPKSLSASSSNGGPVVIEPGKAQLDMTVHFLFERGQYLRKA